MGIKLCYGAHVGENGVLQRSDANRLAKIPKAENVTRVKTWMVPHSLISMPSSSDRGVVVKKIGRAARTLYFLIAPLLLKAPALRPLGT